MEMSSYDLFRQEIVLYMYRTRLRTPIELLGNTSEVDVPLQKIGN